MIQGEQPTCDVAARQFDDTVKSGFRAVRGVAYDTHGVLYEV